MTIRLHDGRFLDSNNFEFHDKFRKVTAGEKRGISLGWSVCADTPGYSIVLVKRDYIVGQALGFEALAKAIESLESKLLQVRDRNGRFSKRMIAIINFSATKSDAISISRTGADAIFMPRFSGPDSSRRESDLLFDWLGDETQYRDGFQKHAVVWPRYELIGGRKICLK